MKNAVEKLLGMQWHKLSSTRAGTKMLASFEGQRFDVVYVFVGCSTRVKSNSCMQEFLQVCFASPKSLCTKLQGKFNGVNFSSTKAWTKVPASIESQRFKLA